MGSQPAELSPEVRGGFRIRALTGSLVAAVVDKTPAEKAGLQRNDVILEFDSQPVSDVTKFRLKVADTQIGKRVPILVLRDGKKMTLYVTLGDRPNQGLAQGQPSRGEPSESESVAGLKVRELAGDEKSNANLRAGVVVTDVEEGSAADDAGIQEGDIIEEVGGKTISTAAEFAK